MPRAPPPRGRPPFVVRELRWGDFADRMAGFLALFEEVREDPDLGLTLTRTPPTEAEEVGWFTNLYQRARRGEAVVVVGEADGHAVGMATVASPRNGGSDSEGGHVGVLGITVDRPYRGRGLGAVLLRTALEQARGRFEIVRLNVFSVNVRARSLYERFGFRLCGHLDREVKRGDRYLDEEIMTLDLAGWVPPKEFSTP